MESDTPKKWNSSLPPPLRTAWFVWGLGAILYLIGFFQRVAPAVMTEELMRDFQIGASALGNLSAYYFYSYVAMQIPTGILADRWGPRRLLSAGAWIAGIGTVIFAFSPGVIWASVGRFLIGGSVAVAFVGMLKLSNSWFPPRYFAVVSGMALFAGIIGAVFAGPPLRLLMDQYSWRGVLHVTAFLTFGIGFAIWRFVRDYPHEKGYADLKDHESLTSQGSRSNILEGIIHVFQYRNTLLLFVIPGAVVGSVLTFSGLWGVPYLTTHQGLTTARAALLTSSVMVAWAVGGPVFGWLSDRWGNRKRLFLFGCAFTLAGWGIALFSRDLSFAALVIALLVAGFNSGCMILSFALAKESVPHHLSGTISGIINMGIMMGPMLLQPAVGWMLDRHWKGEMQAGVRLYGLEAYQAGFSLMLAWIALALFLLIFIRETHCRQRA
jgi:MFS family permease